LAPATSSTTPFTPPPLRPLAGRLTATASTAAQRPPLRLPRTAGTRPEKIRIQKWYTVYKDHITLADYEIHDGMGLELYYN
jgi:hypothetical protein